MTELHRSQKSLIPIACLLAFLAAGCAQKTEESASSSGGAVAAGGPGAAGGKGLRAAVITDVGGVGDKSFNMMAWNGLQKAQKELGYQVQLVESRTLADYEPNIRKMADQGFDVVITVGYALRDALEKAAPEYSNVKFVIVDDEVPGAANVLGLKFREEEGSFLVGALAGGMTKKEKVGFVGGMEIDLIKRFEAGYRAGVQTVKPSAEVLVKYTKSWEDVAKGTELANIVFAQGADIIYHASGKCGLGVIQAARERGPGFWAIGVDADQDYLGTADPEHPAPPSRVLTSMMKRVDDAVFTACKEIKEGHFTPGTRNLGLKEGGISLTPLTYTKSAIPAALLQRVDALKQQIIAGKLKPPATIKELETFRPGANS
jgi:basic membrane protein A and related proteins